MASTLEAIASEAGANDLKGLYQHRAVQDFDANDFPLDDAFFTSNPVFFDDNVFITAAPPTKYDQNGNPGFYDENVGTISINPNTGEVDYKPSRKAKVRRALRITIPLVVIILIGIAIFCYVSRQKNKGPAQGPMGSGSSSAGPQTVAEETAVVESKEQTTGAGTEDC